MTPKATMAAKPGSGRSRDTVLAGADRHAQQGRQLNDGPASSAASYRLYRYDGAEAGHCRGRRHRIYTDWNVEAGNIPAASRGSTPPVRASSPRRVKATPLADAIMPEAPLIS